jgi:hypothetical protein
MVVPLAASREVAGRRAGRNLHLLRRARQPFDPDGLAAVRLTNGFSKKLECHAAAVSLYVTHYNWCRPLETLTPDARHQTTPAMALGIAKHVWSIGELIDAALAVAPSEPTETAPERRRFRVIDGGKS